jgi:hypothetical protein
MWSFAHPGWRLRSQHRVTPGGSDAGSVKDGGQWQQRWVMATVEISHYAPAHSLLRVASIVLFTYKYTHVINLPWCQSIHALQPHMTMRVGLMHRAHQLVINLYACGDMYKCYLMTLFRWFRCSACTPQTVHTFSFYHVNESNKGEKAIKWILPWRAHVPRV